MNRSSQNELSEAPGLYGTLTLEEKLIQKIWNNGEFSQKNLKTSDGNSLEILDSGRLNLAEEGPDFKDATLLIDGNVIYGDIEIHIEEKDWEKHGHDNDPAYRKVILHVLVYPPKRKCSVIPSILEKRIATFFLLPQLHKSLEEHAEEDALDRLNGISTENAPSKDFPQNWEESRKWAYERWLTKLNYAEKRLKASGWVEACHQWLLEVLGHQRNRSPMARIALKYPTQSWLTGLNPNAVYSSQKDWRLRGCRPLNHPKKRLQQYAQLIENCPNWMKSLKNMDFKIDSLQDESSASNRKNLNLKRLEKKFNKEVLGGIFGGTKIHTLMIDACLPLWSVYHDLDVFDFWFHWTAGDVPSNFRSWAKEKGLTHKVLPFCNGIAQSIIFGNIQSSNIPSSSLNPCHENLLN